jgi:hypothetical protein
VRFHAAFNAALVFLFAACASSGTAKGSSASRVEPPEMISRTTFDLVPMSTSRPVEMKVTYEVMIDKYGRPDMSTLKVDGFGASQNRDGIARWIAGAAYKPAKKEGQAVDGLLRGKLESMIRVR